MNGSSQYPARFFYTKYETFDFIFHSAYLVGIRAEPFKSYQKQPSSSPLRATHLVPARGRAISTSDRLVGSHSRRGIEQFHEARLVRITRWGFAIWLDPFGMLDPQIVVNLLLELGVRVDLVRHGHWLGEINEFHKRLFI
jgi:hypothetical protein